MPVQSAALKSPPQARLTFRVGIVGHRPDRLPKEKETLDALQAKLRELLEIVRGEVAAFAMRQRAETTPLYDGGSPVLRAISPLAEGSDRMFAAEAIGLGYELLCPMPFHQEEFENDFLPPHALVEHSCDQFHDLLRRAAEGAGLVKYELDGQRSASGAAYGMAGRVVLNQSDLLIAVWDRGKAAGGGGTVQTLHEAVQYHVPVIWIDALKPEASRLLLTEDDIAHVESGEPPPAAGLQSETLEAQIGRIVTVELGPPRSRPGQNQVTQLSAAEYFREIKPRRNWWFGWKMFRDLVGNFRLTLPTIRVQDFESQIAKDWPIAEPAVSPAAAGHAPSSALAMQDWVNRRLRPHYAWADKLADWYADHYRTAYILIYMLSAIGVLISLLGHESRIGAVAELACVGGIVLLVMNGSRRHWHERWMEYRLLAELIRQIRIKLPLGGGRPLPRTPIHLGIYEDLTQTWMYWHMRAIARATGVPAARVTDQYLLDCLSYMAALVTGQLNFHKSTMKRSEHIAELLHSIASNLFIVSLCFIVIRLIVLVAMPWPIAPYLPIPLSLAVLAIAIVLHSGPVFLILAGSLAALVAGLDFHSFEWVMALFLVLAVLPAFGAAFTGIANQGEFARLEKRSIAMAGAFERFEARIKLLQTRLESGAPGTSMMSAVIALATEITQVMVDEVSDWRVVVAEQPMRLS